LGTLRFAIVAVADVALHLHQRALVVGDRVRLAQRLAQQRLFPMLDRPVGRLRVHCPSLAAMARGAPELLGWVILERLRGMRTERLARILEALPAGRLMAGHAAVGAAQRRNPDLLHSRRHGSRLVRSERLRHLSLELGLVPPPFVLAVVAGEE